MQIDTDKLLQELAAREKAIRTTANSLIRAGSEVAGNNLLAHCEGLAAAQEVVARHARVKREVYETQNK